MQTKDNIHSFRISDEDLLAVSGGTSLQNERGEEIKEGRFITSTLGNYTSGEMPRFSVGDLVKIKWKIRNALDVLCDAEIMGISDSKSAGLLFRKYTYSIKILSCPNSDMIGLIESNVHENCLSL